MQFGSTADWRGFHFRHGFLPRGTMLARYNLLSCVDLSIHVYLSVTDRTYAESAKSGIIQTTTHDSPGALVSQYKSSLLLAKFEWNYPNGTPNLGGVGNKKPS